MEIFEEALKYVLGLMLPCHYFSLDFVTENLNSDSSVTNIMIFKYIIIILFNDIFQLRNI